jgi:hypothetical protein
MREDLIGFDLELTGFDCIDEFIAPWDRDPARPWVCPLEPGCGAKTLSECAAAKQLAKVLPAPKRMQ